MTALSVSLRPVTAADEPFLLQVYCISRADEMALVPWSEEQKQTFLTAQFGAQQQHYKKVYPDAQHDIVVVDGEPAGILYVARLANEIRIVDFVLIPAQRKRGIGRKVLRDLKSDAEQRSLPLRVYVEDLNPSLPIFIHYGFISATQDGFRSLMEWRP